jgi:hypothetical protein
MRKRLSVKAWILIVLASIFVGGGIGAVLGFHGLNKLNNSATPITSQRG